MSPALLLQRPRKEADSITDYPIPGLHYEVIATQPKPTITVRLGTFTSRRRDITDVTAPPHPLGSVDLRILRAWIEAELSHPGDACHAPVAESGYELRCGWCAACRAYGRTVGARVATAIERAQGRQNASGQVGDVYERLPDALRPLFGRREGEALRMLTGRWSKGEDRSIRFVPGLARLTEDEAAVYDWELRGWRFEDIQRELTKQRLGSGRAFAVLWSGDRSRWVQAEVVHEMLESAGRKVRRVFGLDA